MEITDLVSPRAVMARMKPGSKKQLLQEIAEVAAEETGKPAQKIFELLLQRERLGSTGIGNGVAIPHAKLADLPKLTGVFSRLEKPVPFDSMDEEPVDLVFTILAPEGSGADHLKALSRVARIFRNHDVLAAIRGTDNSDSIYRLLQSEESARAA